MKIVLVPYLSQPTYGTDLTNARLRIEVSEAEGITPAIFLHERYTIMKTTGLVNENRFIAVAKPGDLNVFPAGMPGPGQEPPYFRLDCVDVVFNSPDILDQTFKDIVDEVTLLVQAMRNLGDITEQSAIVIEG
jgi:hypothetical protein